MFAKILKHQSWMMGSIKFTLGQLSSDDASSPRYSYFKVLSDYLQPESPVEAREVAQSIDALYPLKQESDDASSAEDFIWGFWIDVDQIACQIPHNHESQDKLISVIRELQALPPVTVTFWGKEERLWTDLPLAGSAFRDAWIGPKEGDESSQEQWINKNAFYARLFGARIVPWKPNFAIWTLRDALETAQGEFGDCYVAAAASWIEHAGQYLYDCTHNGESDAQFNEITAPGELFRGSGGLSTERWTFWKSRFVQVAYQSGSDASGSCAEAAARRMAEIEGGE